MQHRHPLVAEGRQGDGAGLGDVGGQVPALRIGAWLVSMTAQELAVVQAAIADHGGPNLCAPETCGGSRLDPCRLASAVDWLISTCEWCNTETHVCGGCGSHVGHGSGDCGRNCTERPARAVRELIWVLRTWADVRTGDHVRMPDSRVNGAHVAGAVHLTWHVDPRSSEWRPIALGWSGVQIRFAEDYEDSPPRTMDPAKPVEIELSPDEVAAIEEIGWSERIGLVGRVTRVMST